MVSVTDSWLSQFSQPVVLCDAEGAVQQWNQAYEELLGEPTGAQIKYQASVAMLVLPGGQSLPVGVVAREDGTFLAHLLSQPNILAMVQLVARRLLHLQRTLEASAEMGLSDAPNGVNAEPLREILAATEELGRLRRQLSLLGVQENRDQEPLNLRTLVKQALSVTTFDRLIRFVDTGVQGPVNVSREVLFPALVALIERLVRNSRGDVLQIQLTEGEKVRLSLQVSGAEMLHPHEVEAARAAVTDQGGRLLIVGDVVLIELPPYRGDTDIRRVDRGATVLLVDDDDTVLTVMEVALRRAGFKVLLAENGVEGSAILREHPEISALVTDAVLPGRSGLELASEARKRHLPTLLISGHGVDLLGELDLPMLSKPFKPQLLAETVGKLVEGG